MKLSDYVAEFVAKLGIKHAFVVTGGAVAHLIESIAKRSDIEYVCPQHEQAAAMAVDAYARVTKNMGLALVTTGPGVTNLTTGIACLYYDSLPSIFIAGQVSTSRFRSRVPGVRQLGFQEAPHVDLVKPITKYAVLIDHAERIRYELEKAVYLATSGRPGPVFIDIPDDIQRQEIDPEKLEPFHPNEEVRNVDFEHLSDQIEKAIELLKKAKRPILVLGAAVKIAKEEANALNLVRKLNIPVALTWATMDILSGDDPLNTGGFGITSTRRGNFAIQNADLVFSIGSRLDSHATGTPPSTFARGAKKVVVDIDANELAKFGAQGMSVDVLIQADVKDFFKVMKSKMQDLRFPDIAAWMIKISQWREKYPICPKEFRKQKGSVNPYVFLDALSKETAEGDIIVTDCGSNLIQTFQGYCVKPKQQVFSAFNNSPMGYSLAASIGACYANEKKRVICIIGDGGLQVNIQELATIVRNQLPIKIFLFNNHGYGIIQQTQEDWLNSHYVASRPETGLADPDYVKIARAYGLDVFTLRSHRGMRRKIKDVLQGRSAVLCNLEFDRNQRIIPMLKTGRPIEDANPLMDRDEFRKNMIIPPMELSLSESNKKGEIKWPIKKKQNR